MASGSASERRRSRSPHGYTPNILAKKSIIGIGFLGCGDISTLHAEGLQKCEGAKLIGLWNYKDSDTSAGGVPFTMAERASAYGCKVFSTCDELLSDPDIDAVYVLTNMETHHEYVTKALRAGKHVMVEKPVAVTLDEIKEMGEYAESRNLVCMPGHNYIYEPQLLRMKEHIANGSYGRLVQLYVMYNIKHPEHVARNYPGVIRQIMTHHAYVTLFLSGEVPISVSGMKSTINDGSVPQENLAMVMMQMKSGAISVMQTSFANDDHTSDPWSFYIKVLGTDGGARYSYNDFIDYRPHIVHSHTYMSYPYTVRSETEHFINQCLRRGCQPLSTMQDAGTCLRILEAVERSISEGVHVHLASSESS